MSYHVLSYTKNTVFIRQGERAHCAPPIPPLTIVVLESDSNGDVKKFFLLKVCDKAELYRLMEEIIA